MSALGAPRLHLRTIDSTTARRAGLDTPPHTAQSVAALVCGMGTPPTRRFNFTELLILVIASTNSRLVPAVFARPT